MEERERMDERDKEEYGLMLELDQLETIKEEMEELQVSTLAEVVARIDELHARLEEWQKAK